MREYAENSAMVKKLEEQRLQISDRLEAVNRDAVEVAAKLATARDAETAAIQRSRDAQQKLSAERAKSGTLTARVNEVLKVKVDVDDREIWELESSIKDQKKLAASLEKEYQRIEQAINNQKAPLSQIQKLEERRAATLNRLNRIEDDAIADAQRLLQLRNAETQASRQTANVRGRMASMGGVDFSRSTRSAGRFQNQMQQVGFALDDFANSTGSVSNRLRGVSNNLSMLTMGLGPYGVIAGVAAAATLQLTVRYFEQKTALEDLNSIVDEHLEKNRSLISQAEIAREVFAAREMQLKRMAEIREADADAIVNQTERIDESIQKLKTKFKFDKEEAAFASMQAQVAAIDAAMAKAGLEVNDQQDYDPDDKEFQLIQSKIELEAELFTSQQDRFEAAAREDRNQIARLKMQRAELARTALDSLNADRAKQSIDDMRTDIDGNRFNINEAVANLDLLELKRKNIATKMERLRPFATTEAAQTRILKMAEQIRDIAEDERATRKKLMDEVLKQEKKVADAKKMAFEQDKKERLEDLKIEQDELQKQQKTLLIDAKVEIPSLNAVQRGTSAEASTLNRYRREGLQRRERSEEVKELKNIAEKIEALGPKIESIQQEQFEALKL